MARPVGMLKRRVGRVGVVIVVVLGIAAVTVVGLAGASPVEYREACNKDVANVEVAIEAYYADYRTWPPSGPVDKTSVLLLPRAGGPVDNKQWGLPYGAYLQTAPKSGKYSINTDGAGGVLVAVPPARSGGINYDDAIHGKVAGVKNPCDAIGYD
jgi:type II secretory pathway pseudopilin PulG